MTRDEIEAERERFEDIAPRFGIKCPRPVDGVAYTFKPVPFASAAANDAWDVWLARAEIARAEQAELRDEIERLRAENAALRALIENNNAVAEMCGLDLPKPEI